MEIELNCDKCGKSKHYDELTYFKIGKGFEKFCLECLNNFRVEKKKR
jgi:hypothetical protein